MSEETQIRSVDKFEADVKKQVKEGQKKPVERLTEELVEAELITQQNLLREGFELRVSLKKQYNSIKPKQKLIRDIDGKKVVEKLFTEEDSQNQDKLEKRLGKLEKALDKAVEEGDYSELKNHVGNKDKKKKDN